MVYQTSDSWDFCQWGVVSGASLVASLWDLRTQRIPNILTLPLAAAGLLTAAWGSSTRTLGDALAGALVLSLPFVVMFLLAQGGAGDAKMMAAIGAWLGVRHGIVTLACVALAGGVLALFRVALHAQRWAILRNLCASLYVHVVAFAGGGGWRLLRAYPPEPPPEAGQEVTIPYGVAIFLGVCLGAMVVNLWMQ